MENLLNFCWVLLALTALLAWRYQAAHARGTDRRFRLVALLCVLALMFPVISATDDLHPAAQAIEDSSKRTQKAWLAINWVATHVNHDTAPALLVSALTVFPNMSSVEWRLQLAAVPDSEPGVTLHEFGRSPPALTF